MEWDEISRREISSHSTQKIIFSPPQAAAVLKKRFHIRGIAAFLAYSNLWIALGAALLTAQYSLLYGRHVSFFLIIFTGASTWGLYAFHRLGTLALHGPSLPANGRWEWLKSRCVLLAVFAALGMGIGGIFFFALPLKVRLALMVPALVSLLYAFPLLPGVQRLRDLPWVKLFAVSLMWAWVMAVVPAAWAGMEIRLHPVGWFFLERFIWMLGLTLPFDIRDMELDRRTGTRTIPLALGAERSKATAVALLLLSLGMGIVGWVIGFCSGSYVLAFVLGTLPAFGLIRKIRHGGNSDLLFSFGLDGILVLQPLLGLLFSIGAA